MDAAGTMTHEQAGPHSQPRPQAEPGRSDRAAPVYGDPDRSMPIRMPCAEAVRRYIAEEAAAASGHSPEHYLALLGSVEHASPVPDGSWRLGSYHGNYRDGDAIERAIAVVHRSVPLMHVSESERRR